MPAPRYIDPMVVEVYTGSKPAEPRRALIAALLLLAAACVVAWTMAAGRSGGALAPRIKPPGWAISFQRPARFRVGEFVPTPLGSVYRFIAFTPQRVPVLLAIHRMTLAPGTDPRTACDRVLRAYLGPRVSLWSPPAFTWFDKKLGSLSAVEVWDPLVESIVIRGTVLPSGEAYAVILSVRGRIQPELYRVFDRTCASIEHETKR
jgi:hypothetical protein